MDSGESKPKSSSEVKTSISRKQSKAQPAIFTAPNLFGLPHIVRGRIYQKVLAVTHPIYIFQEDASQPVKTFAPDVPREWLALLHTNRQAHNEGSAILYGSNNFHLMETSQHQAGLIRSFIDGIGASNAGHLSRLCINFPTVQNEEGEMALMEDGVHSLTLLKERCTKLKTLEFLVYGGTSGTLLDTSENKLRSLREACHQIDARLRVIMSLTRIIVRFAEDAPSPSVTSLIRDQGWEVILRGRTNPE